MATFLGVSGGGTVGGAAITFTPAPPQIIGPADNELNLVAGVSQTAAMFSDNGDGAVVRCNSTGKVDIYSAANGDIHVRPNGTGTILLGAGSLKLGIGTGTPESAVTAPVGSLFLRTDGGAATTLYVKTSGAGNTGWTAK